MSVRKPSMWLEGFLALIAAAVCTAFFYYFGAKWAIFDKPNFTWLVHLNFPLVGGFLALAFYFFFPNQSWRMPLILLVAYLMFMTGYPPDKKLSFGLDLAGGTEMLVRIEKSPELIRADELKRRLIDIDLAKRAADGEENANKEIQDALKGLNEEYNALREQIADMAQDKARANERRRLQTRRDQVKLRIDDLSGKAIAEIDSIREEIRELEAETTKTNVDQVLDILRERILATSLAEIRVSKADDDTILIQIPGLDSGRVDIIKSVIERQGILEFRLVKDMSETDTKNANDNKPLAGYDILRSRDRGETLYVEKKAPVTGSDISSARPQMATANWQVALKFTASGRRKFAQVTRDNVNKRLGIVLDGELMIAPNIQQAITDGQAVITGDFTRDRAEEISTVIRAGSLPVKLTIDSENKVGAALGEDSIRQGTTAMVIGFCAVVAIMVIYYLSGGVLAVIALFLNGLLIIGLMGLFKATLTLPGIAGIVLTLGMAVDANVLIFERIREEKEAGKALKVAIKNGYERAFITIFDANLTTILTAIVLYVVGTVLIKSFAVTLIIGLIVSMFTAVFVTRCLVEILYDAEWIKKMNMLRIIGTPSFDFLRLRYIALVLSIILNVVGIVTFIYDAKFGIDFTGGQMLQVRTVKAVPIDTIRGLSGKYFSTPPTVQIFGGTPEAASSNQANQFIITYALSDIPEDKRDNDREINDFKEEFKKYLRANLPELASEPFPVMEEMLKADIRAAKYEKLAEDEILLSDFMKVEMNLLAARTTEEVKSAINKIEFKEGVSPAEKLQVLSIEKIGDSGTGFSMVLRTEAKTKFNNPDDAVSEIKQEIGKRLDESKMLLADPFPAERLVGSSLSSDLQSRALWAIILSSILMLLYITFRFTFSFGLGAIFATLHDLFITIGFIAILRVDITLDVLAAILTVIGYSLNDTIVVFDRIRENMKTLKRRDFREVLNLSINQVLMRTILTSLTTVVVVLALLLFAGDVLYGFSITLLIGIITGTYSSVFIATPVVAAYYSYREKRDAEASRLNVRED